MAFLAFMVSVAIALGNTGTAYVWQVNLISDLGDGSCHTRGGRWICSPGSALFNTGLMATGVVLTVAGACLSRLWGRLFAGSVVVMGVGLVIAGAFPAGDDGAIHLAGVILALVVPGFGLLLSGIRPASAWLHAHRVPRGVLGGVALVFCAESRLPEALVPRGAGEVIIIGSLLAALLVEAARLLASGRSAGRQGDDSATEAAEPGPQRRPVGERSRAVQHRHVGELGMDDRPGP